MDLIWTGSPPNPLPERRTQAHAAMQSPTRTLVHEWKVYFIYFIETNGTAEISAASPLVGVSAPPRQVEAL